MNKFAVIQTGGKQYIVEEGQEIKVEKLATDVGGAIEFDALLVSDADGSQTQLGNPIVSGIKVKATVLTQGRGKKILVVKYKPKVRYRRHVGHRQPFTKVKIDKITA